MHQHHLVVHVLCDVQVNFGELFFGESASRCLTLVNNSPTEACFDLSFGSVAGLKALLATGPDEQASTADDRLAAFLQVARIRVSAAAACMEATSISQALAHARRCCAS
jgi:hypothetical protein